MSLSIISGQQNAYDEAVDRRNRFYNDIYYKKLRLKFDGSEVKGIYRAVNDFVWRIVKSIERRRKRLKIDEVISVGSAREGTQICIPCEFDFLLILKELSCPGVISITKGCPDSLGYLHVALDETKLQRMFADIAKDGYLKSTQEYKNWVYREENGLREKLEMALQEAALANRSLEIKNEFGTLKFKRTSIESHGPAFMIHLTWQSKRTGDKMDISVDLCPAVRMSENLDNLVSPESVTCQSYYDYVQSTGSVLLIPCRRGCACVDGLCFKVAYTETEMCLMDSISEHHKKCYKILKYLINGRSGPSVANKSVLSKVFYPFFDYPTDVHSYALKVLIWNHHFKNNCDEKNSLSSCMDKLLDDIKRILEFVEHGRLYEVCVQNMLPCPFNKHTSIWSKYSRNDYHQLQRRVELPQKEAIKERFNILLESIQKFAVKDDNNLEDVNLLTVNNAGNYERVMYVIFIVAYNCLGIVIFAFLIGSYFQWACWKSRHSADVFCTCVNRISNYFYTK